MAKFKPGDTIRFTYNHDRDAIDENTGDKFKEIFILHPEWKGQTHAIDLKRLTEAERTVLNAIMDPETRGKPHAIPLVNDILTRMNPIDEIKNPIGFYQKFVKVFLRGKDAYRLYWPRQMFNVTVVTQTNVRGNVLNPKPLFHKIDSKPQPTGAVDRLVKLKAAAQKAKDKK